MYVYIIADKFLKQFFVGLTENINSAYKLVYPHNCETALGNSSSLNVVYHAWFHDSSEGIEKAQGIQKFDRHQLEAFISKHSPIARPQSRYSPAISA
jgi:predicted GIY-YIG superfamily endonuclease